VRPSTPADARAIGNLWKKQGLLHEPLGKEWTLADGAGDRFARGVQSAAANPRSIYFVGEVQAKDSPRIAGFLHARVLLRNSVYRESVVGEIAALAVDPDFGQNGLCSALVAAAMDWFRSRSITQVEFTLPSGEPSHRPFLESVGFRESAITLRAEV